MDSRLSDALEQVEGLLANEALTDQQYKLIIEGLMVGHNATKESAESNTRIQADYVASLHRQYMNSPDHPGYSYYNADILGGYAAPVTPPDINTFNVNIQCNGGNYNADIHVKMEFFVNIESTPEMPANICYALQHSRQYLHGQSQDLYRFYSHGTWGVWLGSRNHVKRQIWQHLGLSDSQILAIYNIVQSDGAPSTIYESKRVLLPRKRVRLKINSVAPAIVS
jgi:hypothetical protein